MLASSSSRVIPADRRKLRHIDDKYFGTISIVDEIKLTTLDIQNNRKPSNTEYGFSDMPKHSCRLIRFLDIFDVLFGKLDMYTSYSMISYE